MPEWSDDPRPPRPRQGRRSFWQRLGSDLGFGGMAQSAENRPAIDALRQYDDEEGSGRGLLSYVPGWLLLVLLLAVLIYVLFFSSWV